MVYKHWNKIVLFCMLSILLECTVFNYKALFSLTATHQRLDFFGEGRDFYATDMTGAPHFLYIGVDSVSEDGTPMPVTVRISLQDEGDASYYEIGEATIYPALEKSKYLSVHSYGDIKALHISLSTMEDAFLEVSDVIYDAKVPWFISVPRILAVFVLLCLAWCLRPGSAFYAWNWKAWQKRLATGVLLVLNIGVFFLLVRSNPAFLEPVWPYHHQYHQLAVALSQGKVSIDAGDEAMLEALMAMENPYDYSQRMQSVENVSNVWDTCYYEGNFYVYFGIVPALMFHLPYYLLFHGEFPTWLGVFLTGSGALGGVYYLLDKLRKRWFPQSPYAWYLILAVLLGNGLNLFWAMIHADLYYLPITTALCFSLWGLGLMMDAANHWHDKGAHILPRLAGGALCLALTAGCRPQFLVGSFLLLPVFLPLLFEKRDTRVRGMWKRLLAAAIPYILVALGVMYYNAIRFGSVFDFGASYNLTTNDMTRRGIELGRLPDGIFMYLFQPVSMKLAFPFAEVTAFYSDYLGVTVRDWTYGGAFWIHPILLGIIGVLGVKGDLRKKKALGLTAASVVMALVVVAADTEMAGLLNRYCTDFLWLLMIPAAIVLLQLLENARGTRLYPWILWFVLIAGAWGSFYELATAFRGSGIMGDNMRVYYMVRGFFS